MSVSKETENPRRTRVGSVDPMHNPRADRAASPHHGPYQRLQLLVANPGNRSNHGRSNGIQNDEDGVDVHRAERAGHAHVHDHRLQPPQGPRRRQLHPVHGIRRRRLPVVHQVLPRRERVRRRPHGPRPGLPGADHLQSRSASALRFQAGRPRHRQVHADTPCPAVHGCVQKLQPRVHGERLQGHLHVGDQE